jgi:glutamine cyclotransferase
VNGDTWYDTDNDTYDVYINDEWKRFLGAGGGGNWTVDLSNVTYDSVSFNADLQESTPHTFAFNADGTKMYILGINDDTVYQYSLSTAFDISTGSYDSVGFSITNQEGSPYSITFNTDGTKMYVLGDNNDRAYQYSLTTGFDVSTASYDNVNFNFTSQTTGPQCMVFNPDGTKMFIIGPSTDRVYQYSLSTGFDVSTASYDSVNFSVTSQDSLPRAMAFNSDGTKMYVVGQISQAIFQYSLTTGFDVSTASYDSVSFSTSSQDTAPFEIRFSTSGNKMYVLGRGTEYIYQYSTGL